MPDLSALHVFPSKHPLLLSFPIFPEEIELAFATNGESLRMKAILEILSQLVIAEAPESDDLTHYIPWVSANTLED